MPDPTAIPTPMPVSLRPRRAAPLLPAAALLAACSDSPTGPTDTRTPVTPSGPSSTSGLTVARYFGIAMDSIQYFSINEAVARSSAFRSKYEQQAASATTFAQTYPVLQRALTELDPHSSVSTPQNLPGSTDAPVDRPDLRVQSRMATPRVGYVYVPGFVGRSQSGRIDSTHQALRALDANGPCGWIVDLRRNNGGFFFALMASVGPLYAPAGDGRVGAQRYAGNYVINWHYRQRANGTDAFVIRDAADSAQLVVQNPWRPRRPGLPVAVLHNTAVNAQNLYTNITASAGESITLAFRGGPPTRSFGGPTYGVASGRRPFFMPDSARVDVTDSYMLDRNGFTPGDNPIAPDVSIPSSAIPDFAANDAVVDAAVAWLEAQPACTGARPDAASRSVAPSRVDQEPTAPPAGRRLPGRDAVYALPDAGLRLQ
ncbi:S41 family peptidase [Roseisolibacter sp. H3M3-2]|uniref:S41 family peptidase n=1 Tax=Roseisolibacter sp. H3M3-2 TaxID=3031323 RepID=UPI0023DC9AD1|nr:S41 family peptidase [Roseisolibacter sp. H3M3-2]MDF1504250.1 S41 family peptidase [Roseisolibacter sp. H3M3-2]